MKVIDFVEETFRNIKKQSGVIWNAELTEVEPNKGRRLPIYRMLDTYAKGLYIDCLSHLRQVCVSYGYAELQIPSDLLAYASEYAKQYGFITNKDRRTVSARPYVLSDEEDLAFSYSYEKRRVTKESIPDVTLMNLFGYSGYISLSQKMMIHTLKETTPGSTYLACLPTGNGKSLLWQYAAAIGKYPHSTIVVIPTNALGADHLQSDHDVLSRVPWVKSIMYSSEAYSKDPSKLEVLCEKIESGEQLILYISPEGLTNTKIKKAICNAAKNKYLSALVIDEAHLVVDWGMKFRPEFQFLPAFVKTIKQYSNNTLYTVLLSATFTEYTKETLLSIFGREQLFEYRGDELRPEITFYNHHCKDETERRTLVKKLLYVVPRPAIVYVGTVEQSKKYTEAIRKWGFVRTECFNGETGDTERTQLIDEWRNDNIDIMVATSAFGMGVDKSDVRTVITAYTPENISRYYQEVGRAGRDGYSALNFALYCPIVDKKLVDKFTDSQIISTELLWKRWKALADSATNVQGDSMDLNTDTKHEDLLHTIVGGKNAEWNENVISLLARAGFLSIENVRRQSDGNSLKSYVIRVKILDMDLYNNKDAALEKIEQFREMERGEIVDGKNTVKEMFEADTACYGDYFFDVFDNTSPLCNGCPYCRKNELPRYINATKGYLVTRNHIEKEKKYRFRNNASVCTNSNTIGMLSYSGILGKDRITELIRRLSAAEASIFVIEDKEQIDFSKLQWMELADTLLLSCDEIEAIQNEYLRGTIVFFITEDAEYNNRLFELIQLYKKRKLPVNQILIAPKDAMGFEEGRKLSKDMEYVRFVENILEDKFIC